MNNQSNTNDSAERSENLQQRDNSIEDIHNDMDVLVPNPPILSNVVQPSPTKSLSPLRLYIDENPSVPLSSAAITTTTTIVTSNSLLATCAPTTSDETAMQNNLIDTASSITVQHSSLSPSESASLTKKIQKNQTASQLLAPSTTVKRRMASSEALKEIKNLMLVVNAKDAEIKKLTDQNEKLKNELNEISKHSISM
jgi:hypothetical protein